MAFVEANVIVRMGDAIEAVDFAKQPCVRIGDGAPPHTTRLYFESTAEIDKLIAALIDSKRMVRQSADRGEQVPA